MGNSQRKSLCLLSAQANKGSPRAPYKVGCSDSDESGLTVDSGEHVGYHTP